ncbi:hypothetical protein AVEN_83443-1 [Araneus ventricosus]|uniref:Reverse transcriptase domain-containing protein n=1 Tax=Araneus ventricosus TaxID=182803 RepID=A0A4Y2N464_ARAVE|nr:hypothetical protein AVEN_83443-1 [Araneus ventricosus]
MLLFGSRPVNVLFFPFNLTQGSPFIGIRDHVEVKSRQATDEETVYFFRKTVKRNKDKRVVFGASPSPFLLAATIVHHLENILDEKKKTDRHLQKSFYVDNCIITLESKEETAKFISEAKELMFSAQFELRGWVTSEKIVEEAHKRFIPILGLSWDTEIDELFCNSIVEIPEEKITKRTVLFAAHRLFDPIGVTCTVPLVPKVLLQNIWKRKINWDDELLSDISNKFLAWVKELHFLKDCKIPRRLVSGPFTEDQITYHCFCDASEVSYAACIFLRSEFNEKISVKLVPNKSRVALVGFSIDIHNTSSKTKQTFIRTLKNNHYTSYLRTSFNRTRTRLVSHFYIKFKVVNICLLSLIWYHALL